MPDAIASALVGAGGALVVFLLGRVLNWRRDQAEAEHTEVETEASVARQWQEWSAEQGRRIDGLEARVRNLEDQLLAERAEKAEVVRKNERLATWLSAALTWALLLRDEVHRRNGVMPPTPVEVEEALTTLEL